jgi:YihY family inner membrane protein
LRQLLRAAPVRFIWRVLVDFRRHQGLLLASAVAYNTLLSIVPLFALLLAVLAHFVDQAILLRTISHYVELLLPGRSGAVVEQAAGFVAHREVIGAVSALVLLFFSSIAFMVLENAMAMIFLDRTVRRRHFVVSAILPYLFILALALALLLVTLIAAALDVLSHDVVHLLGRSWSLAGVTRFALWLLTVAGSALLLTGLYLVMPVGRISFRHALLGGVTATALWEIVRRGLAWYLANVSMVNVIYGSLATSIVVLLTLEAGALIVLFGAQIIAELEQGAAGARRRPWRAGGHTRDDLPVAGATPR